MKSLPLLVAGGWILAIGMRASGQAPASTVQLPTFSQFSVQTTVSVPDRGGMVLGGVNRGADSAVNLGPIRNRGLASSRSASGMSVSATIIDHAELDRAILAEAAARRGGSDPAIAKSDALSRSVARSAPADSVAAIRASSAAGVDLEAAELAGYFSKAQQAEADGKSVVAKIFYDMVARRDKGQLRQQAVNRLAAMDGKLSTSARR